MRSAKNAFGVERTFFYHEKIKVCAVAFIREIFSLHVKRKKAKFPVLHRGILDENSTGRGYERLVD